MTCGRIVRSPLGRPRKYCSHECAWASDDRCRNIKPKDRASNTCLCCGVIFKLHRQSGKGSYCSRKCARSHVGMMTIEKIRRPPLRGSDNPRFRGVSRYRHRAYRRYAWRLCKKTVLKRDKACRLCGSVHALEFHHILPFSDFPLLVADDGNVILLCEKCHYRMKGREYRFVKKLFALTKTTE